MSDLKPCPFCSAGARAYIAFPQSEYPWHIDVQHGETCPMRIPDSICYRDEAELIEAWDTRTPEAADKLEAMQAALEGARDALTPELCDILGITDALNLNRERG